ncbi:hypothetical protein BC833DRAFT_568159 [Globomyces pollinis-pini]|nr:hypothetical protein BC833DRAFT_568159 [Globomyces pollinis-pini]
MVDQHIKISLQQYNLIKSESTKYQNIIKLVENIKLRRLQNYIEDEFTGLGKKCHPKVVAVANSHCFQSMKRILPVWKDVGAPLMRIKGQNLDHTLSFNHILKITTLRNF